MPILTRRLLTRRLLALLPQCLACSGLAYSGLAYNGLAAAEALTLDQLMAVMAAAPQRRDRFREERRFAALDAPLLSAGTLAYANGHMEKLTEWPQRERLEVDGDHVAVTLGDEPPRVIGLDRAPELRVLVDAIRGPLSGDAAALRRGFDTVVAGTLQAWSLDLVPHDPAAARLLRAARVEGRGDRVDRIAVTAANGDTQVMTITPR